MTMGLGTEELQRYWMIGAWKLTVVMSGKTLMFSLFLKDTDKDKRTWSSEIPDTQLKKVKCGLNSQFRYYSINCLKIKRV